MTPYDLPDLRLEVLITPYYYVNLILYNSVGISILLNYFSILYGVHVGESIAQRLLVSHTTVQVLYIILYCAFVRVQNIELYADMAIERGSYVFAMILLYSCHAALTYNWITMSLTGTLAHNLLWREHITILRSINDRLIKNE